MPKSYLKDNSINVIEISNNTTKTQKRDNLTNITKIDENQREKQDDHAIQTKTPKMSHKRLK